MEFSFNLSQAIELRIHGGSIEKIRNLRELNPDLSLYKIKEMLIHHLTPEFILLLREKGFKDLSIEQMLRLKQADVFEVNIKPNYKWNIPFFIFFMLNTWLVIENIRRKMQTPYLFFAPWSRRLEVLKKGM